MKGRSRQRRRRGPAWLLQRVVATLLLGAALAVVAVDWRLRTHFAGERWALPARLLARPLELSPEAGLRRARVESELALLGYARVAATPLRGEYRPLGGTVLEVVPRTTGTLRRLRFAADRLVAVEDAQGVPTDAAPVLEAFEYGALHGTPYEDRRPVRLRDVPPVLVACVLAIEDQNFMRHPGLDPLAILRALAVNLRAGDIEQGGSTLTQQLVKNFHLGRERTLARKVGEAVMALLLEARYSKEAILEAWLNEIYLGQDGARAIHGVATAAHHWFGRPLAELGLHQHALLAALANGPAAHDPRRHPERARQRRNLVLGALADLEWLPRDLIAAAQAAPLDVVPEAAAPRPRFPAFVDAVGRALAEDFALHDLHTAGLRVQTTLDAQLQMRAEALAAAWPERLEQAGGLAAGTLQIAIVALDVADGSVRALVGDRHARAGVFNRALAARRSIGSLAKPFVVASALAAPARFHAATPVADAPIDLAGAAGRRWRPANHDGRSEGMIPLHRMLAHSRNQAAVRLALAAGLDRYVTLLRTLGAEVDAEPQAALALGVTGFTPIGIARLYGALASSGLDVAPAFVTAVQNGLGKSLGDFSTPARQVLDPRIAFVTRALMTRVVTDGTASAVAGRLAGHLPLAGKTGTTDEGRDSWYVGFDARTIVAVWIGRDDGAPAGLSGAGAALRVYADLVEAMPPAPLSLEAPKGVGWYRWDAARGVRLPLRCPGEAALPFIETPQAPPVGECRGAGSAAVASVRPRSAQAKASTSATAR